MTFQIKNLNKSFGNKKAVNNISIQLEEGQILGMLGRNGAGKTTTIRMMLELIPKDSGQILWKGKPFSKEKLKNRLFTRRTWTLRENERFRSNYLLWHVRRNEQK